MGIPALVMAGGKGTRMQHSEEKPLIQVGGKPLIERVVRALQSAKSVELIIVAVSHHTPKTAAFASRLAVRIATAPGKGYIHDLQYLVKQLKLREVLTVAADLPLVKGELIDEIVRNYESCRKPALTVVASVETKKNLGLGSEHSFQLAGKNVVPVGINIIDGQRMKEGELDQEVFLLDRIEVALNVNTPEELVLAERLVKISQ